MTQKKKTTKKKGTRAKAVKKTAELIKHKKADEGVEGEVYDGKKDQFGRPTVITAQVKQDLLAAYAFGCPGTEAALFANISYPTLKRYFLKDPDFKDRCMELQEKPVLLARMTLIKAIATSPYYALKLLERLKADEFSLRVKQTFEDPEPLTEEEQEALNMAIDENL